MYCRMGAGNSSLLNPLCYAVKSKFIIKRMTGFEELEKLEEIKKLEEPIEKLAIFIAGKTMWMSGVDISDSLMKIILFGAKGAGKSSLNSLRYALKSTDKETELEERGEKLKEIREKLEELIEKLEEVTETLAIYRAGNTMLMSGVGILDWLMNIRLFDAMGAGKSSLNSLRYALKSTDATAMVQVYEEQTDTQNTEEEGKEDEEEDGEEDYIAMESLPHETDEVNVKPIQVECCKRVGVEGGKLQLDSFGIELEIPPGAIDSEAPMEISLRVLTDTRNLGNSKEEVSVCFGVQCSAPDDLVLKLPVTYTIPHCAVITRYSSVKAVLYTGEGEYSPDAVVKERIMLSRSGIPSCTIRKDVLQLKMNHFSWAKIKLRIKNFFFRGKKMCCWPFREKNLALEKTPVILQAHLYDDIRGNSELVKSQEGEYEFVPAHMERQVLIKAAEVDLKMTCSVKETVIGGPAVVSFEKIMSGTRICEPFELDFPNQSNTFAVSLKVGQNKKLEVNLLFRLEDTDRREKVSPQDQEIAEQLQGASSSQTLQTSRRSTGETPENISGRQEDFDDKLATVARKIARHDEIDNLGKALGFEPEDIQRYVDTNMKHVEVSYMGTLSMLRAWRKKQTKATEYKGPEGCPRERWSNLSRC